MDRVPQLSSVSDEQADEDLKQIYEMCRQAMGGVPHLARVIANSKELLVPFLQLAGAVAMDYTLPMKLKQLAVLRTSELNGCAYCLGINVPKGRAFGIESHKIEAVTQREVPASVFTEEERLVIQMADEITGAVGARPGTMARSRELFGEAGTVELLMIISFYNLINRLAESTQVPLEG